MSKIFVKPATAGLEVPRDYDIAPPYAKGQTIAQDGEWVESSHYIARRKRGGDLVEATPPAAPASKEPESAAPPAAVTPKPVKRST